MRKDVFDAINRTFAQMCEATGDFEDSFKRVVWVNFGFGEAYIRREIEIIDMEDETNQADIEKMKSWVREIGEKLGEEEIAPLTREDRPFHNVPPAELKFEYLIRRGPDWVCLNCGCFSSGSGNYKCHNCQEWNYWCGSFKWDDNVLYSNEFAQQWYYFIRSRILAYGYITRPNSIVEHLPNRVWAKVDIAGYSKVECRLSVKSTIVGDRIEWALQYVSDEVGIVYDMTPMASLDMAVQKMVENLSKEDWIYKR